MRHHRPRRRLLQHDVRVGSAEAERIHAGNGRPVLVRPRLELGHYAQAERWQIDRLVRLTEVERRGNHPALERKRHFDQAGHSQAASRWPRLVLTEPIRRAPVDRHLDPEVTSRDRARLYRVPGRRAGAVRLDIMSRTRLRPALTERRRSSAACAPDWDRHPARVAVLIDGGRADHRVNRVASAAPPPEV